MEIKSEVISKAKLILAEAKKAKHILVHCHPSPDPDSVGSALAMKFALDLLGLMVTVIRGDSEIPQAFAHFPGYKDIVEKSFFDVDLNLFDLFIILDSASPEMISRRGEVRFPPNLRTVIIDHHRTNPQFADLNLLDAAYPSTAQLLYDVFMVWGIKITPEIAANLFIGMYTDTGGFKYEGTTSRTFTIAADLAGIYPEFPKMLSNLENTNDPSFLIFQGKALSSIEEFMGGRVAVSSVPFEFLKASGIMASKDASAGAISAILRTVPKWSISAALVEVEPNRTKASFRTSDAHSFDVSKLAAALGGGGHKAAAGANIDLPLREAKQLLLKKIEETYTFK